jgi:hypothetical protein
MLIKWIAHMRHKHEKEERLKISNIIEYRTM